MQYPQPIHHVLSTRTTPSGTWKVAPTGQTCTQGGFSHWLQSFGTKNPLSMSSFLMSSYPSIPRSIFEVVNPSLAPIGESACVFPSFVITYRSTHVRVTLASYGISFSSLHALTHIPHPTHL